MRTSDRFRQAVVGLHRQKTAAYGPAWKKRGEVMGVLCNVARKVDRIEFLLAGGTATPDEALVDTCVDLLVYAMKYKTLLADLDAEVAAELFHAAGVTAPYSDGVGGFEALMSRIDLAKLDDAGGGVVLDTLRAIVAAYASVENAIVNGAAPQPAPARTAHLDVLIDRCVQAIAVQNAVTPGVIDDWSKAQGVEK